MVLSRRRVGSIASLFLVATISACTTQTASQAIDVAPPPRTASPDVSSAAPVADGTARVGCSVLALTKRLRSGDFDEARNTVGAIARSAIGSFEREQLDTAALKRGAPPPPTHVLCKSAEPFPREVPRCAERVVAPASLFRSGPDDAGWHCLRFDMTEATTWQYGYIQGGPYKGLDRGASDPGRDGFQAYAERDADGDGKTALIIQVGTIAADYVALGPELEELDVRE